jgi:site-specific DNA-methyltransferase (adenine-specific)
VSPHYVDEDVTVYHGACLAVMRTLPDGSVDAVVTDPPYGLGFMGRAWDDLPPGVEWATECLRVLKPGGHLLAFGGTRTWHRLAVAVEDAGFELRDSIAWLYGSGFPKSLDVSKAIDKAAGAEREVVGVNPLAAKQTPKLDATSLGRFPGASPDLTAPATRDAERWQGWGTALKPAFEPIVVGRKPLAGTVAANVLAHGTGALNIDACRVGTSKEVPASPSAGGQHGTYSPIGALSERGGMDPAVGRWPTNVVLDESQAAELDRQSDVLTSGKMRAGVARSNVEGWAGPMPAETGGETYGDRGGASRFFPVFRYHPKAPASERPRLPDGTAHPTVKPLGLMRWLVRLVTPPSGLVLDTFAGSGTTAEACVLEGMRCIVIEREAEYLPLIVQRLTKPLQAGLDLGLLS